MVDWELTDDTTIDVFDWTGTNIATLNWADYNDEYPNADGWTWVGDYPDPVKEVAMWEAAVDAYQNNDTQRMGRFIAEAAFEQINRR